MFTSLCCFFVYNNRQSNPIATELFRLFLQRRVVTTVHTLPTIPEVTHPSAVPDVSITVTGNVALAAANTGDQTLIEIVRVPDSTATLTASDTSPFPDEDDLNHLLFYFHVSNFQRSVMAPPVLALEVQRIYRRFIDPGIYMCFLDSS